MSADEVFGWSLAILGAVCLVGWLVWEAWHAPTEVESTPLDDLMDGPEEQVAEDRSAADMWDSFEEAVVHGIEVDDTAAEADMVNANGPAVLAQGLVLVAEVEAFLRERRAES